MLNTYPNWSSLERCNTVLQVYLHPRSALASTAPRFAVYTELLQAEKRAYMSGVCSPKPGPYSPLLINHLAAQSSPVIASACGGTTSVIC